MREIRMLRSMRGARGNPGLYSTALRGSNTGSRIIGMDSRATSSRVASRPCWSNGAPTCWNERGTSC